MKKIVTTISILLIASVILVAGVFATAYYASSRELQMSSSIVFVSRESYFDITLNVYTGDDTITTTPGTALQTEERKTYTDPTQLTSDTAPIEVDKVDFDSDLYAIMYVFELENVGLYDCTVKLTPDIDAELLAVVDIIFTYSIDGGTETDVTGSELSLTVGSEKTLTVTYVITMKSFDQNVNIGASENVKFVVEMDRIV